MCFSCFAFVWSLRATVVLSAVWVRHSTINSGLHLFWTWSCCGPGPVWTVCCHVGAHSLCVWDRFVFSHVPACKQRLGRGERIFDLKGGKLKTNTTNLVTCLNFCISVLFFKLSLSPLGGVTATFFENKLTPSSDNKTDFLQISQKFKFNQLLRRNYT